MAELTRMEPQIIAAAQRGDKAAFAQIVAEFQTPVYNLAYRMLGNRNDAEDAAQETFLRAYAQLKTYDPGQSFGTWLLSVAAHYCIDRLRRRKFQWLSFDDPRWDESAPRSSRICHRPKRAPWRENVNKKYNARCKNWRRNIAWRWF